MRKKLSTCSSPARHLLIDACSYTISSLQIKSHARANISSNTQHAGGLHYLSPSYIPDSRSPPTTPTTTNHTYQIHIPTLTLSPSPGSLLSSLSPLPSQSSHCSPPSNSPPSYSYHPHRPPLNPYPPKTDPVLHVHIHSYLYPTRPIPISSFHPRMYLIKNSTFLYSTLKHRFWLQLLLRDRTHHNKQSFYIPIQIFIILLLLPKHPWEQHHLLNNIPWHPPPLHYRYLCHLPPPFPPIKIKIADFFKPLYDGK